MKKILISAGQIPARLDSVKFIGNRFHGGLAIKTAQQLATRFGEDAVTVVKWKYTDFPAASLKGLHVHNVIDVDEYLEYVTTCADYDTYILAGAIANLMPVTPFIGKFPSHDYTEEDVINIPFKLVPRVIDRVKKAFPRATLIGYKLYDGSEQELIRAARETLSGSNANVVFANTPADAKTRKLAVLSDGAVIPMSFEEHIDFMCRQISAQWFSTTTDASIKAPPEDFAIAKSLYEILPGTVIENMTYGTFAYRIDGRQFVTTSRGKRHGLVVVRDVNTSSRTIQASEKATLNTPMLAEMFRYFPDVKVILHNHKVVDGLPSMTYALSGTTEDVQRVQHFSRLKNAVGVNIQHHGYVIGFSSIEDATKFIQEGEKL